MLRLMIRRTTPFRRSLLRASCCEVALRSCSTVPKASASAGSGRTEPLEQSATPEQAEQQPAAVAAGSAGPNDGAAAASNSSSGNGLGASGSGIVLQAQEEENLPPLAFEPGVVGAAQKGVSAVVIAFGAAALGACMWGASQALFPSATRYALRAAWQLQ